MKRILLLVTLAVLMAAMLAVSALPAIAQPPPHRHFLTTPQGTTHEIAGGIACAAHQPAFTNFHENVHTGAPGEAFADNPVTITAQLC